MRASHKLEEKSLARVSVGIKATDLDTDDVTRIVGIEPTRAVKKGDQPPDRSVPSVWGIWMCAASSEDMEQAVREVLQRIEPVAKQLREAAGKYNAELTVGVFWQPEGGQGGYSLPADVVHRLSLLGDRVDFYFS